MVVGVSYLRGGVFPEVLADVTQMDTNMTIAHNRALLDENRTIPVEDPLLLH